MSALRRLRLRYVYRNLALALLAWETVAFVAWIGGHIHPINVTPW